MKHKNTILAVSGGVLVLFLICAWLFWGSTIPQPTDTTKKTESNAPKAAVYNTTLNREENGKPLWKLNVGEAVQVGDGLIKAKQLDGIVYLKNGDEMHVKAETAELNPKKNEFVLTKGVTARLKQGGFLKANKVEWKQKEDVLTAIGAVKVIKEDMLATAETIITSGEFKHFKLKNKAHVERGGKYDEN